MWTSERSSNLNEGDVLWKFLVNIFQPLQRLSEGGEVRHHCPAPVVRHKAREDVSRCAAQQVELDVELFALLFRDRTERLNLCGFTFLNDPPLFVFLLALKTAPCRSNL